MSDSLKDALKKSGLVVEKDEPKTARNALPYRTQTTVPVCQGFATLPFSVN